MHREQSGIATIELNANVVWEVAFKTNAILSLEDVVNLFQQIRSYPSADPILMDWNAIQGIEFEALEYIAQARCEDQPLAIVAAPGSIGEKYSHLINQLCESNDSCYHFSSLLEARNWLISYKQKEA